MCVYSLTKHTPARTQIYTTHAPTVEIIDLVHNLMVCKPCSIDHMFVYTHVFNGFEIYLEHIRLVAVCEIPYLTSNYDASYTKCLDFDRY